MVTSDAPTDRLEAKAGATAKPQLRGSPCDIAPRRAPRSSGKKRLSSPLLWRPMGPAKSTPGVRRRMRYGMSPLVKIRRRPIAAALSVAAIDHCRSR